MYVLPEGLPGCSSDFFLRRLAQISHSEQVQITPPLMRAIDPPAPDASAEDLETQADHLRARNFISMRSTITTRRWPRGRTARLLNKIGITELMMQRYKEARKIV